MRLEEIGLREQPFRKQGPPVKLVKYYSQQQALKFLHCTLKDERGVGLLHGPDSSGKSTLVRQFVEQLPPHLAVAVVDGARIRTRKLLSTILAQFGYQVALHSPEELLNLLNVLVVQQARTYQAPVLILENVGDMNPGALRALCRLAGLTVHKRFALRIILVSNHRIRPVLDSPGMRNISQRMIGEFELGPLTAREALTYLYLKLQASGVAIPDNVLPVDVCDALHLASDGWPGVLDELAAKAIQRAEKLPVSCADLVDPVDRETLDCAAEPQQDPTDKNAEMPKLLVTMNGKTLQEKTVGDAKMLIGRSFYSDIIIDDPFASLHHALLVRFRGNLLLLDLKSRNGTFVNSRKIRGTALRNNDIISLGHHRIKLIDGNNRGTSAVQVSDGVDTVAMQSVPDMRRKVAEKKPHSVPLSLTK